MKKILFTIILLLTNIQADDYYKEQERNWEEWEEHRARQHMKKAEYYYQSAERKYRSSNIESANKDFRTGSMELKKAKRILNK